MSASRGFRTIESSLRADGATEPLLRDLLGQLEDLGCVLCAPRGEKQTYLNVRVPGRRGRIATVNTAAGRTEFQNGSWERIGHVSGCFVRLPAGNKAAHPTRNSGRCRRHRGCRSTRDRGHGLSPPE